MDLFGGTPGCFGTYYEQIQETHAAAYDEKKRSGCSINSESASISVCGKELLTVLYLNCIVSFKKRNLTVGTTMTFEGET